MTAQVRPCPKPPPPCYYYVCGRFEGETWELQGVYSVEGEAARQARENGSFVMRVPADRRVTQLSLIKGVWWPKPVDEPPW